MQSFYMSIDRKFYCNKQNKGKTKQTSGYNNYKRKLNKQSLSFNKNNGHSLESFKSKNRNQKEYKDLSNKIINSLNNYNNCRTSIQNSASNTMY